MLELKVTQKSNSCPRSNKISFFHKRNILQNSPKKLPIICASLKRNFLPRSFKNHPIWSHWLNPETRFSVQRMKKEDRWAQSYKENLLHKMMCAGFERSDWLPKIIQPIRVMISVTRNRRFIGLWATF